jgi:hypothetical protein
MLGENFRFWDTQWEVHGTCTHEFMDQSQYFDTAIRIYKDNNLFYMFRKNSFKLDPNRTYRLTDSRSFLQRELGNFEIFF